MKIQDRLSDEDKKKLGVKKEKLTERDLRELMNRDYKGLKRKKGGAWTN
jgi:uncharacterized ferredoxin-like protein